MGAPVRKTGTPPPLLLLVYYAQYQVQIYLNPILMPTSVAVEPLSVKNTRDAQPLPGPSTSLSATCSK